MVLEETGGYTEISVDLLSDQRAQNYLPAPKRQTYEPTMAPWMVMSKNCTIPPKSMSTATPRLARRLWDGQLAVCCGIAVTLGHMRAFPLSCKGTIWSSGSGGKRVEGRSQGRRRRRRKVNGACVQDVCGIHDY